MFTIRTLEDFEVFLEKIKEISFKKLNETLSMEDCHTNFRLIIDFIEFG